MKKIHLLVAALLLIGLIVAACAPGATGSKSTGTPAKAVWETEWEKVLAAAREEGTVHVQNGGGAPEYSPAMVQGLKDAYGIEMNAIYGKGASEVPKIQAERKAGLYLRDGFIGGYTTVIGSLKPEGIVDPLEYTFIQPHLTDPATIKKVWYHGQLWWVDQAHYMLLTVLQPYPTIAINTNLVKDGEIKSYNDLLDPKWKGKIIQGDPTIPGVSNTTFEAIYATMGEAYGRKLAQMDQVLSRDDRQVLDWLATGKMAIAIAPNVESMPPYEKARAPIKTVALAEGVRLSGVASAVSAYNKPAHPNALKVWVNWITSKEGQEAYARAGANHSLRIDVPTDYLKPEQLRQEGAKYYEGWSEAAYERNQAATKLAREIFAPKK